MQKANPDRISVRNKKIHVFFQQTEYVFNNKPTENSVLGRLLEVKIVIIEVIEKVCYRLLICYFTLITVEFCCLYFESFEMK